MSALRAGDDSTVLGLVDPEIELVPLVVSAGLVPDPYRGLDGIRAYLEDAHAADVERGFVASRVRGAQDTVVAFGDVLDGPEGATMPALWIWQLRDGLVTHGTLVSDESALRAARNGGPLVGAAPRGVTRSPLRLQLSAAPESAGDARHAIGIWADNLTLTGREHNDIMLAVSEAATNVVRHGYPAGGRDLAFGIFGEVSDGQLLIALSDDGVGLGAASPNPGLGMGLPLLGKLATSLLLVSPPDRPRGLEVRMWFDLASLAAPGAP
jgi:serine/threonine-protein kinase RsbW